MTEGRGQKRKTTEKETHMQDKRLAEIVGMTWRDMMNLADECLGPDEERIESGIIAAREYGPDEAWKMFVAAKLLSSGIVTRNEMVKLFSKIPGVNGQKHWRIKGAGFVTVTVSLVKLRKKYLETITVKR